MGLDTQYEGRPGPNIIVDGPLTQQLKVTDRASYTAVSSITSSIQGSPSVQPVYEGMWSEDLHRWCNAQLERVGEMLVGGDQQAANHLLGHLRTVLDLVQRDHDWREMHKRDDTGR